MPADLRGMIDIVPALLWVTLALVVFLRLEKPFREQVLPRITGLDIVGFRVQIGQREVEQALKKPGVAAPPGASDSVLARVRRSGALLRDAAIVWVDDEPTRNSTERRFFHRLGTFVEIARSDDEALTALEWGSFDVVISNMRRGGVMDAGLRLIHTLRERKIQAPVILYVSAVRPGTPAGAFGITNRPDELYHLILDALERQPWVPTTACGQGS